MADTMPEMADTMPEAAPTTTHQIFTLVDARTKVENLKTSDGCGCGGHGGSRGGCGCGGHGHGGRRTQSAAQGRPAAQGHSEGSSVAEASGVEELDIHALPKVVRHALVFHAMDILPIGENIRILAPHAPQALFEHLQNSESHYRVETFEEGPLSWRYRITRLS
ncbi:DUF2249 domain-containing protein [Schaalia cardiffensis]